MQTTTLNSTTTQPKPTDAPMTERAAKRLEPLARLVEAAERGEQRRREAARVAEARAPRPFAYD